MIVGVGERDELEGHVKPHGWSQIDKRLTNNYVCRSETVLCFMYTIPPISSMRAIRKHLGVELAANTIYDVLKFVCLGIVAVGTSAVASNSVALSVHSLRPLRWPVVVIFSSFIAWLFLIGYGRWSRSRPKFTPLYFDFILKNHEIVYIYRADKSVQYHRRKDLQALKNNMKSYIDKYNWTGKGRDVLRSAISGQQVRRTRRRSIWQMYEIEFPAMRKGQVQPTEVIWELEDTSDSVVPFISATVEEPTEKLTFRLWFAPETGVTQVSCEVLSGIGGKSSFTSFSLPVPATGTVVWTTPHPKLLHHYEVSWEFPNRRKRGKVTV
jgi:hypothetical protein